MTQYIEGNLSAERFTFAIVVSRYNEFVTRRLVEGALDCLRRHGADETKIDVVYCPGAFEIPQTAQIVSSSGKYSAVICLGCIMRGDTPHFDHIAGAVTTGLTRVALHSPVPVVFGILTTDSLEQAVERAGAKGGNKGWEAALSAIELADLRKKFSARKK